MIALMTIFWLVVCFGAFAAGRLRGLRESLEVIMDECEKAHGPDDYIALPLLVAGRIAKKTERWAPWSLWR